MLASGPSPRTVRCQRWNQTRNCSAGFVAGGGGAFVALVERYNGSMLRLAVSFVPSRAIAEEVVQDTWLAMLGGLAKGSRAGRR